MVCNVETPNGKYRCLLEATPIREYFGDNFSAKGVRVFLFRPDGTQVELPPPSLGECYGPTEGSALAAACREFEKWAREQPAESKSN